MKCGRIGVEGSMDRKRNGRGIQFVGSSWAKKMIVLRTEIYCVWLYYNVFNCVVNIRLIECYVRYWTSWEITSLRGMFSGSYNFVGIKLKGDNYVDFVDLMVL